jgi:hypothetical protein
LPFKKIGSYFKIYKSKNVIVMLKFFTRTICMALVMTLCAWSLQAQRINDERSRQTTDSPQEKPAKLPHSLKAMQEENFFAPQRLNAEEKTSTDLSNMRGKHINRKETRAATRELCGPLWNYNYGGNGSYGYYNSFIWNGKLYSAKWNQSNGYGFMNRYTRSGGVWIPDGNIQITGLPSGQGNNVEGFCTDGTYIYCAVATAQILRINPATWAVNQTINISGGYIVDGLAYDAVNGHFWICSFGGTVIRRVNASGVVQQTLNLSSTYGAGDLAWENISSGDGTPYLWVADMDYSNLCRYN